MFGFGDDYLKPESHTFIINFSTINTFTNTYTERIDNFYNNDYCEAVNKRGFAVKYNYMVENILIVMQEWTMYE